MNCDFCKSVILWGTTFFIGSKFEYDDSRNESLEVCDVCSGKIRKILKVQNPRKI
jgi:hypothetical protein